MKWPTLPRRGWLLAALAIGSLAVAWQLQRRLADVAPAQVASEAGKPIGSSPATQSTGQSGEAGNPAAAAVVVGQIADVFAVRTWEPPPLPVDATPPPPQAPPLPFRFLGRIVEPGKAIAYILAQGLRVFVVSVGDAVGPDYRVEKYENGQLLFHYRPMNIRQSLDVGNRS